MNSSTLALTGLALVFALLLMPIPVGREDIWSTLENTCHPLLFALVAMGIVVYLRTQIRHGGIHQRTIYVAALLLAVALGGITELAQLLSARDASWIDFANDALGTVLGLALLHSFETKHGSGARWRWLAPLVAIAASILAFAPLAWSGAAYLQRRLALPMLWQYRNVLDEHFLEEQCSALTFVTAPPAASFALRNCAYAGFSLSEPYPDWSNFRTFRIELSNPDSLPLRVTLRIQDRTHNWRYEDRFNRTFDLAAREHSVLRVPVYDILHGPQSRKLDLAHMSQIMVFVDRPSGNEHLVLHEMRLEH